MNSVVVSADNLKIGYSENLAAIIVIPFLAIYSFLAQKYFVFKK